MEEDFRKYGLGMYTVHKSVKQDMYGTFLKLAEMGYRAIEFYGEMDFDVKAVRSALQDSGLTMTGWHVEWRDLQKDRYEDTVKYLQQLGCPTAVIPCLGGKWQVAHEPSEECKDIWLYYADEINRISEKLKKEGIRTGYHNHEHEFQLVYEGKRVFNLLFDNLSEEVIMEFDSGNCIEGGADPVEILSSYPKRDVILHLKPYSPKLGFDIVLGSAEDANDWNRILKHRDYLWYLIESENTLLPEAENAALCLQGLQKYMK